MDKKQKLLACCIGSVMVILTAIAYFVLPEQIGMQISSSGGLNNQMPKALGLLLAPAFTAVCLGLAFFKNNPKALLLSAVGPVLQLLTIFINL